MTIRVCGKQHMKGTSKRTGNAYDFIAVHYLGKARGVEGLAALTMNLDGNDYRYEDIYVSADYHVEFDNKGYPVEFSRISPPAGK